LLHIFNLFKRNYAVFTSQILGQPCVQCGVYPNNKLGIRVNDVKCAITLSHYEADMSFI